MNFLKTKQIILIISIVMTILSCKAQQTQTTLPKVENHLKGELDYTYEALELVQTQANGQEIGLGKINKDGTIHFNLPEFNIKAIYDSIPLQHYKFQDLFLMNSCKDKDAFAETPFDAIYAQKYNPIFVKKYGIDIAALYPVSDEKIVSRNENNKAVFSGEAKYFWFYIDRDITYKDECIKTSFNGIYDIELAANADIQFKKGWNFIEENLVEIQNYSKGDYHTTLPKNIQFTSSSPASKKVKWVLKQIKEDGKIQTAKKLYNLTPITKEKFEKWAPNKLGDLSVTTQEHGNPPRGQKNKNTIHLIYANETQKKEIDLYVVDCAKSADDMEMINFSYAMENRGKDAKDIKPYIAQYSERQKAMSLLYKVEDRVFVTASGVNINAEELWEYIKKLNVKKLLKKQDDAKIIYNSDSTTVKFEGIITNAKNDCWVDGTCSIQVNNKWWVAITYGKRELSFIPKERGLVTGIRFTKDNESIGEKVKVFAKIRDNNKLTLEGSNTYYVKVIE